MFWKRSVIAVLLSSSLLTGCGFLGLDTDRRDFRNLSVSAEEGSRTVSTVRWLSHCPTQVEIDQFGGRVLSGAGALVAGFAADFLVGALSGVIEDSVEGRDGSFVALGASLRKEEYPAAAQTGDADGINKGCIVVYRAAIGPDAATRSTEGGGKLSPQILQALDLADYPAFYVELKVTDRKNPDVGGTKKKPSPDTAFVRELDPVYVHYADTSARRRGSGRKTVTMAVALGITQVPVEQSNKEVSKAAASVFRFNLGRLEIGSYYGDGPHHSATGPAVSLAGTNMVALISESDEPSIALNALASAFESNEGDLKTLIKDAVTDALGQ